MKLNEAGAKQWEIKFRMKSFMNDAKAEIHKQKVTQ